MAARPRRGAVGGAGSAEPCAHRTGAPEDLCPASAAHLPSILALCHWPLGTNLVEGINVKIKVIKRMAYGYRDDAYFFLKARAAFPGLG